jgi:GNAT superfamily N-acetyltransferase
MAFSIRELSVTDKAAIATLGHQLNPDIPVTTLEQYLEQMFSLNTYHCFGLYDGETLIGISSGWITVRFYSGKQLEIDNVIIDAAARSKGVGAQFMQLIEQWASANDCKTVELNAYVQNSNAHRFYFREGYRILGFHFQKKIS